MFRCNDSISVDNDAMLYLHGQEFNNFFEVASKILLINNLLIIDQVNYLLSPPHKKSNRK